MKRRAALATAALLASAILGGVVSQSGVAPKASPALGVSNAVAQPQQKSVQRQKNASTGSPKRAYVIIRKSQATAAP